MFNIFLTPKTNIVESYLRLDSMTHDVDHDNIDISFKITSPSIYAPTEEATRILIEDESQLPSDFFKDCTKYIYQDSKFLIRPYLELSIDDQYIIKNVSGELIVPLNIKIPVHVYYKDPDGLNFQFDYLKLKDRAEFLEVPDQLQMIDNVATFNIFSPFPGVSKLRVKDNNYLCYFNPLIVRFKYVSI